MMSAPLGRGLWAQGWLRVVPMPGGTPVAAVEPSSGNAEPGGRRTTDLTNDRRRNDDTGRLLTGCD